MAALVDAHGPEPGIPTSLTPLIGREREVAQIADLLREPPVRLVTLTGPGGVGKTRLAMAVARDVGAAFPDGVRFVGLAAVTEPDLVASAVVQALGVKASGEEPSATRLIAALRGARLLLVLDNFEHVVEAAPLVSDLLTGCPDLRILATSRVRLQVSGEHGFPVPPLALPRIDEPPSVDGPQRSGAVRLFEDRARAIDPTFALTPANAEAVVGICRHLDGLPLAIELAAARIAVLSPVALLSRLERRLPLLTGGRRDAPARHRTVRDAIAWSIELLTPAERALFSRVSVFVGGFTLDAAEAVAGGPDLDVLDGIGSLVDNSLLRQHVGPDGEPRYLMLETIREYGVEQLEAGGEAVAMRRRHAAWCVRLAEDHAPHIRGPGQARAAARLDGERGNLRSAFAWLLESNDADGAMRLALALGFYWSMRAHQTEARRWLEAALDGTPGAPTETRAAALHALVVQAGLLGDHATARSRAEEGLALARQAGGSVTLGRALFDLGLAWEWSGDGDRAATCYGQSVAALRAAEAPTWLALALVNHGHTLDWQGHTGDATAACDEGLALYRSLGDRWGIALATGIRAHIARSRGDHALAARLFRESIVAAEAVGDERCVMGAVAGLAGVALARGFAEQAARLLGGAAGAREAAGVSRIMHHLHAERIAAMTRVRLGEAAYAAAGNGGRALPFAEVVSEALALAIEAEGAARPPRGHDPAYRLTPRETDVLRLLVGGRSDKQIAEALYIGPRTVQTHVANLFAKLGVSNRAEAAAVAVRQELV